MLQTIGELGWSPFLKGGLKPLSWVTLLFKLEQSRHVTKSYKKKKKKQSADHQCNSRLYFIRSSALTLPRTSLTLKSSKPSTPVTQQQILQFGPECTALECKGLQYLRRKEPPLHNPAEFSLCFHLPFSNTSTVSVSAEQMCRSLQQIFGVPRFWIYLHKIYTGAYLQLCLSERLYIKSS